jgi:hypothetical protein
MSEANAGNTVVTVVMSGMVFLNHSAPASWKTILLCFAVQMKMS